MRGLEIKVIKQDQIINELVKEIEKLKFEISCLDKENREMETKLKHIHFISDENVSFDKQVEKENAKDYDDFLDERLNEIMLEIILNDDEFRYKNEK